MPLTTKKDLLDYVESLRKELIKAIEEGYYLEFSTSFPYEEIPGRYQILEKRSTGEIIFTLRINKNQKVEYK